MTQPIQITAEELVARAAARGKTLSLEDAATISAILGPNRDRDLADGLIGDFTGVDLDREFRDRETGLAIYESYADEVLEERSDEPREDVVTDLVVEYRADSAAYAQRLAGWNAHPAFVRSVSPFPMPYGPDADPFADGGPVLRAVGRVLRLIAKGIDKTTAKEK
jgi:hypothetical protein